MATSLLEQESCPIPGMEFIYLTETKIKYINTNFKKVKAKIYDHMCDVKLQVGTTTYKAHRDVLSEASDYFAAMFSHNMKEKKQDTIELLEITPMGISVILDYFYHGHVTIDSDIIEDVLEAARFFHVEWLLEACSEYIVRHLVLENYQEVLTLADRFCLVDLKGDIFKFFAKNISILSEKPDFYKNLSVELLSQFLRENIYIDVDEEFIMYMILDWVRTERQTRKEYLIPLLRLVRFPLFALDSLDNLPKEVLSSLEIRDAVEEAKDYHYIISAQSLKTEERFQARGSKPVLTVMSFSEEQNAILYKEPEKSAVVIEQLSDTGLQLDFEFASSAKVGNFLYALGGYGVDVFSSERVFRFDPRHREWTEMASMNFKRVSFASCSSGDKIYVFGGINHHLNNDGQEIDVILDSVEVYHPYDNAWIVLPDLIHGSYYQSAAYVDDDLYLTGGISEDPRDPVPMTACYKFSLGSLTWEPIPEMQYPRHSHSMTLINKKLYVIGGFTSSGYGTFVDSFTNEVFDIETMQWSAIATTPVALGHIFYDVCYFNDIVYVLGEAEGSCCLHSYDVKNNKFLAGDHVGANIRKICLLNVAYPID
ncbi:kelch-like protein 36 [Gigantopelta aegis]|uniref:kelch-like protein 36 n=1 Tax=Gigantopelta aegis TaxID=1735272 RepID=UPI001B887E67|nr:kelch-like protein 36 [Gigantopelta aegis]XP_041349864.1 kelch-like protein 36 [Gigantopelta aegis]